MTTPRSSPWSAWPWRTSGSNAIRLAMAGLLSGEIHRGRVRNAHATAALVLRKELQKELFAYLAGGTTDTAVRRYLRVDRETVVEALFEFQATVRGDSRDRLCGLAL